MSLGTRSLNQSTDLTAQYLLFSERHVSETRGREIELLHALRDRIEKVKRESCEIVPMRQLINCVFLCF